MLVFAWILLALLVFSAIVQLIEDEINLGTFAILIFFILYLMGHGRL